jgi:AcrR family transcriptional regulator
MTGKRRYTLKERAKSQAETRQRIVEATMALHEEIGPRATTISAIAARAGVQRLTVYRHFPDENAVFQACTSHWLSLNSPPDPEAWEGAGDLAAQREAALAAFHAYYARTRAMWHAAHRDVADVPALQEPMAQFAAYVAGVADALGADLGPLGARRCTTGSPSPPGRPSRRRASRRCASGIWCSRGSRAPRGPMRRHSGAGVADVAVPRRRGVEARRARVRAVVASVPAPSPIQIPVMPRPCASQR